MILCPDCASGLRGLTAERCRSCGWTAGFRRGVPEFLSTRDRSSAQFRQYLSNYDQIAADDLEESLQSPQRLAAEAARVRGYLGDLNSLRVAEVGVGQGFLFELLRQSGAGELTGIDVALDYLERLVDESVRLVMANAENLPFAGEFDLLVATDILEHVLNPGDFLLSARRAVAPGGQVFIRVPVSENLIPYARLAGCEYEFVHLRSFDRRGLARDLKYAGFRAKRWWYDGYDPIRARRWIAPHALRRRLGFPVRPPWEIRTPATTPTGERSLFDERDRGFGGRVLSAATRVGNWNNLISRALMRPVTVSMLATRID